MFILSSTEKPPISDRLFCSYYVITNNFWYCPITMIQHNTSEIHDIKWNVFWLGILLVGDVTEVWQEGHHKEQSQPLDGRSDFGPSIDLRVLLSGPTLPYPPMFPDIRIYYELWGREHRGEVTDGSVTENGR